MKKIAITQRVTVDPKYAECRDCLDQRWLGLFEKLGFTLVPVPNGLTDVKTWADSLRIDGLILSGGNSLSGKCNPVDASIKRDATEKGLLDWASKTLTPVLGFCRGLQMINCYLGGAIEPIIGHSGTRHIVSTLSGHHEVNSYHNFGIPKTALASELYPIAWDKKNFIEGVEHRKLPWLAVMWHPERETILPEIDRMLFNKFLNF
jgi:putative glutamine amidotransferase